MNQAAIGYKIRQRRKELSITQANLAKMLEISASYLNLIESNKRSIGGTLLQTVAQILELDIDQLSGATERRLRDDLSELSALPLLSHIELETHFADEIVAQNPQWARIMLSLYRAFLDRDKLLHSMNNRLNLDPQLQSNVHKMLTHITSIRSTSEILNSAKNIDSSQSDHFHTVLQTESADLTNVTQNVLHALEQKSSHHSGESAYEQVDEFIISNQNYFPELEAAAQSLRTSVTYPGQNSIDDALAQFLTSKLGVSIRREDSSIIDISRFHNHTWYDEPNKTIHFLANIPHTSQRFQITKIIAETLFNDILHSNTQDARLTTPAAQTQARKTLAAYIAGAVLLPYESFLSDAEQTRYDIEILRQKYNAGFEQVCHRLITLRAPEAEGIPFAFLRADPSGHISKRFPLAQFPLPRYGHACPLWSVFSAFQTPGQIVRQLSEFTNNRQYLMLARTVSKRGTTFHDKPTMFSIMLACDVIHADRTVYAEGIDLSAENVAQPVGPACSQCTRNSCSQRQESAWTLQQS